MENKKPYLVAILIQTIYAGMFLLSKAAFNKGMSCFIFNFYRQAVATIFLLPIAFVFERRRAPAMSWMIFLKMFMLALCGITLSFSAYGIALGYTTPTLAAATTNTLPAIIFVLAILLRMEVVNLKRLSGNAKVMGIVLCLSGAIAIAFYKGPHFNPFHHLIQVATSNVKESYGHSTKRWIEGVFIMLMSNISWGFWLVLQVGVLKAYPSKLLFTTIECLLSTIQCFVIAIALEGDFSRWKLGWDIGLLAVVYAGIVVTGMSFYLQSWCVEKKGPVFLAMFTPLSLLITIICSAFFLAEMIYLGSVIGGILMIGGLYCVLWGKDKEEKDGKAAVVLEIKECNKENEMV